MKLGLIGVTVSRVLEAQGVEDSTDLGRIFEAAHTLGARSLELGLGRREAAAFVDQVGAAREKFGMTVELGFGLSVDDTERGAERFAEFCETVCRPLGVRVVGTVSPFHGGRWLRNPPLDEQLERVTAALAALAPHAERAGVHVAIENHADYRCAELAAVVARVGSPAIGVKLDTGNTYCAIEEPMTAAQAVARLTVATHIKDQIVEAEPGNRGVKPGGLLALADCPLGAGHVDVVGIVDLLAKDGPLGDDLVLTLEVMPQYLEESLRFARRALAPYLSD
ncbi:MAG TPA: sugar phosphate isomerase/epimerase family protein [Limnochordia bacterium]